jgi:gliding motility-associated-like protein
MLKSQRVILFILFLSQILSAQKQANIWYFGNESGIEFTTGVPIKLTDGKIDSFEGCAAFCDENGNLLFYTNGGGSSTTNSVNGYRDGILWNRNHALAYNMMDNQGGGYGAAQSSLFLPKPGDESIVYLFTMDHLFSLPNSRGLSVFEIDLNQNNGIGEVILADERVYTPAFEALTATQHANGEDFWLVCIDENTLDFVVILVDENGIQSPTIIPSGLAQVGITNRVLKISPNGEFLATNSILYTFDNTSGAINLLEDITSMSTYSFTFSPESRYLYTTTGLFGDLIRYDMQAPIINDSKETLTSLNNSIWVGLMQIGPDGNIYYLNQESTLFDDFLNGLDVIKCPDSENPIVEKTILTFPLDTQNEVFLGLPNYADHIFQNIQFKVDVNLGQDTLFACPGDSIILDAIYPEGTYEWSTGETTQTILGSDFGLYTVTVTSFCGEVSSDSIWVENLASVLVLEPDSVFICEEEEIMLIAETVGETYEWSTGEEESFITVSTNGEYMVTITNDCETVIETYIVEEIQDVPIEIISEVEPIWCPNDTISLSVVNENNLNFLWSTMDTTNTIRVIEPDVYSITVSDLNDCFEVSDEIEIIEGLDCCSVQFPNAFTPDEDQKNEVFMPILESCSFASYNFKIYNRWGDLVFESQDSDIGWDGVVNDKPAASDVFIWTLSYRLNVDENKEIIRSGELVLLR